MESTKSHSRGQRSRWSLQICHEKDVDPTEANQNATEEVLEPIGVNQNAIGEVLDLAGVHQNAIGEV